MKTIIAKRVERKPNLKRIEAVESLAKKLIASEYKDVQDLQYYVGTHHIVVKVPVTIIVDKQYIDTLSYEEYFYVPDNDVPEHWIATSVDNLYKASATKTFIERPSGTSIKPVSITTLVTARKRYLARH